jgi:Fe2+ transport system protein FeoA
VLRLLNRRKSPPALPIAPADSVGASCTLAACAAGARATVLAVHCGEAEACRLRALGLCEGASVSVLDTPRHCTLLNVRGSRLALGSAISAAITVLPIQS